MRPADGFVDAMEVFHRSATPRCRQTNKAGLRGRSFIPRKEFIPCYMARGRRSGDQALGEGKVARSPNEAGDKGAGEFVRKGSRSLLPDIGHRRRSARPVRKRGLGSGAGEIDFLTGCCPEAAYTGIAGRHRTDGRGIQGDY